MAKSIAKDKPANQIKAYVKEITVAWRKALDGILEAGRLLNEAHERLDDKAWHNMVTNDLPFTQRTADKLRKIANDERLTNRKHLKYLPPRWTTLHELTYLTDEEFQGAIKLGAIHPDLERKEAKELAAIHKRRAKAKTPLTNGKIKTDPKATNGARIVAVDSDPKGQIAVIKAERILTDEEATDLEDGLNKLAEEFGLTFTYSGYSSEAVAKEGMRKNLAQRQRRWIKKHQSTLKKRGKILRELTPDHAEKAPLGGSMTEGEITILEEAMRQIQSGKYIRKQKGKDFHPHDVRNPKNKYHEWFLAKTNNDIGWDHYEMYEFCKTNRISTRYTPIEFLDYFAHLEFLVFQHSMGNDKQRKEVEAELTGFIEQEQKIHDAKEAQDRHLEDPVKYPECPYLPAADALDRDPLINHIYSIKPGYAAAALERLVR